MRDESKAGCLGALVVIFHILVIIGCGFLAWTWVDPDDFGTGLLFVLAWGAMSAIGHFVIMFLFALIEELFN